ncbi:hypothetical protein ARMGADRAFT_1036327 [Armillaria gallica]|uniref:Uncharacterized protein n=1 Tax=Armillaria gallica TaxID=47427 RepID=A0A2H3D941_ARMGA|nr:hypothetical protein ARMGADRAFT_1036327 [Armillaria gallica]
MRRTDVIRRNPRLSSVRRMVRRCAPDSPFKRGVPVTRSPKKTDSANVKFIPVDSSPLNDTLDSNPSLDIPLRSQFIASLALPKSFGYRTRTTTDERLEFFGNEEWAPPRLCGARKKCVGMYMARLAARGETDEAWFYRKKTV